MNSRQIVTLTHAYAPFFSGEATYATGLVASLRSLGCEVVVIASDYSHHDLDVIGAEESYPEVISPCNRNSPRLQGEIGKSVQFRGPPLCEQVHLRDEILYDRDDDMSLR